MGNTLNEEKKIIKRKVIPVYNDNLKCFQDWECLEYDDKSWLIRPYFKLSTLPKDLFGPIKKYKVKNIQPMKKTTKTKKTGLPYELFIDKSGHWKWRKRARNGKILNHEYNSKAGAIKGMKADYDATLRMGKFDYKEV